MGYFERLIRSWVLNWIIGPNKFSAFLGSLASLKLPRFILYPFLKLYIMIFEIDMELFQKENYKTFNQFFTRRLKTGIRQFHGQLLSPAESVLSEFGLVNDSIILGIKGMKCKLEKLCGKNELLTFKSFGLFYLSPSDYHRVHAPIDLKIDTVEYIEGDLYSVQPKNVEAIDNLFCENKRVVIYGDSIYGKYAIVLVGALVVGKIVLNFGDFNFKDQNRYENLNLVIKKGEELGMFELGSTVILFFENSIMENIYIQRGTHVLVGENLLN